jgi:hypothetical protein
MPNRGAPLWGIRPRGRFVDSAGGMRGCASRTTGRDAGYVQKMRAKITFPADSIRERLSR